MFKTFNKISHLKSYILSVSCIAVSNHLMYIVPLSHLNTGIQGPSNVIISLNQKKIFNYYDYWINY